MSQASPSWGRETLKRQVECAGLYPGLLHGLVAHRGVDQAGCDAVDPDPVLAIGVGDVIHQAFQPRLSRGIGGLTASPLTPECSDGRDVDNGATATRLHDGNDRLREHERCGEIHGQDRLKEFHLCREGWWRTG